MINFDWAYLFLVTIGWTIIYFPLYYLFYYYHTGNQAPAITKRSASSLLIIVLFSLLVYVVASKLPGFVSGFGNRVVHAMGGGFLGMMLSLFVVKDSKLKIDRFRFFIFAFLIVTALGVANEIIECLVQNFFSFSAAITINDTWFDLISNTVGAILGGLIFTPFILTSHKKN